MIELREYTKGDAERLVRLADNARVSRYLIPSFPCPYTLADAVWWIATGSREHGAITRVIEYRGEFAGSIGIAPQPGWRSHVAEIGYWIGEEYWGRGIATAALGRMCAWTFDSGNFSKLYAPVLAPNRASMRVLEKNGFVLEGILRREVRKAGAYHDLHHYAKYRDGEAVDTGKA